MSYRVKLVNRKDPIVQLKTSKTSIEDPFNDLFKETKSFNYQISENLVQKIQRQWNWLFICLVQFNNKNGSKS